MSRSRSRAGRAARAVRLLVPWRSPLARGSDRLQGVLVLLLVVLALAPLALVGPAQGAAEHHLAVAAQAEVAGRERVTATLLEPAALPSAQAGDVAASGLLRPEVPAAWTGPDGRARTGLVAVEPGARAGQRVAVWADDAGTALPDPSPELIVSRAWAQVVLGLLSWWSLLGFVHLGLDAVLDRQRDRWWTAQWARTGPRWTSHR